MPQPKQTKGGGKDDGGKPTHPTPQELAKQAEEMPITGHLARMIEQDGSEYTVGIDRLLPGAGEDSEEGDGKREEDAVESGPEHDGSAVDDQAEPPGEGEPTTQVAAPPSVGQIVKNLVQIIAVTVVIGLERLGRYNLATVFANESQRVLQGKPTKDKVFAAILRHPDMYKHRRRLTEALDAAAVEREWEENVLQFESRPPYSHRVELAKVKDPAYRLQLARQVDSERLTFKQLQERIREHARALQSDDLRKNQRVVKQLTDFINVMSNEDNRALLRDKNALKAAVGRGDRVKVLECTDKAGGWAPGFGQVLKTFGDLIEEIALDERRSKGTDKDDNPQAD